LTALRGLLVRVRADFPPLPTGGSRSVWTTVSAGWLGGVFQVWPRVQVLRLVSGIHSKFGFGAVIAGTPAAEPNPSRTTRGRFRRAVFRLSSLQVGIGSDKTLPTCTPQEEGPEGQV